MNIPDYSTLSIASMAADIGLKPKHIPMLVESYLEESEEILTRLEEAIRVKDYESINHNAHSIKGSSGNLHFNEIYEMAKSMELAGKNSDASFAYAEVLECMNKGIATISLLKAKD